MRLGGMTMNKNIPMTLNSDRIRGKFSVII